MLVWIFYRTAQYFVFDVPRYNARSEAAQENRQFLTPYNLRRSGDVITIVGTAVLKPDLGTKRSPAFAVNLDGLPLTVTLSGAHAHICLGDRIAASGTYHYNRQGGTLWISDSSNVSREFKGYVYRLDFLILAFDPNWCGFPGMPINHEP